MVSKKSHILILSAALSTVTMAGGVAATEFAAHGPSVPSVPASAHVVSAKHFLAPAAHELEAGDES